MKFRDLGRRTRPLQRTPDAPSAVGAYECSALKDRHRRFTGAAEGHHVRRRLGLLGQKG
jgi:hypothetical protein